MLPKYDTDKLERAMYDFNRATGVSITLFDLDKKPVTFNGSSCCKYCATVAALKERKHSCSKSTNELLERCKKTMHPEKHICRAGLLDIAIPLIHADEVVGFLMIGQIKQNEKFPEDLFGSGADYDILKRQYELIPLFDEEKISSIINIGTMLTRYIMLENMVRSQPNSSFSLIESYVVEHLGERISVNSLAKKTHISVSGIYKCLSRISSCTPGEFICKKRLEKAISLLSESELSISEIAEATGFGDTSHFSKKFKKTYGTSPLKYRKDATNCN